MAGAKSQDVRSATEHCVGKAQCGVGEGLGPGPLPSAPTGRLPLRGSQLFVDFECEAVPSKLDDEDRIDPRHTVSVSLPAGGDDKRPSARNRGLPYK